MSDGMIHIPAKRKSYVRNSAVVRIKQEAYNAAVDICNESSMSLSEVVSEIILQSLDRIVYDGKE